MIFGIESDVSPARIKSIAERAVTVFTAAYGSAVWFQTYPDSSVVGSV